MPDIYTKVKYSDYCNLINQNKSLTEENAKLKAEIEKLTAKSEVKAVEVTETETKKETKKGGTK